VAADELALNRLAARQHAGTAPAGKLFRLGKLGNLAHQTLAGSQRLGEATNLRQAIKVP
jgi:hypothetical protein